MKRTHFKEINQLRGCKCFRKFHRFLWLVGWLVYVARAARFRARHPSGTRSGAIVFHILIRPHLNFKINFRLFSYV